MASGFRIVLAFCGNLQNRIPKFICVANGHTDRIIFVLFSSHTVLVQSGKSYLDVLHFPSSLFKAKKVSSS
jgi:hypothetical protein